MNGFCACLFPCFGDRAVAPEEAGGGLHRRHRLRPCRRFLTRLIHMGRRNQRDQKQVDQSATIETEHAVEASIKEERGKANTNKSLDLEAAGLPEISSFDIVTPNFTDEEEEEEKEEDESSSFTCFTGSDPVPVMAQPHTNRTITVPCKVQFMFFCFFFLMCCYINTQQEVPAQDSVQLAHNSFPLVPILETVANTSFSPAVVTTQSDKDVVSFEQTVGNEWSWIKCVTSLLCFGFVIGLYLVWESIFCGIMLSWYLLRRCGVRDELRLSRWLE